MAGSSGASGGMEALGCNGRREGDEEWGLLREGVGLAEGVARAWPRNGLGEE